MALEHLPILGNHDTVNQLGEVPVIERAEIITDLAGPFMAYVGGVMVDDFAGEERRWVVYSLDPHQKGDQLTFTTLRHELLAPFKNIRKYTSIDLSRVFVDQPDKPPHAYCKEYNYITQ